METKKLIKFMDDLFKKENWEEDYSLNGIQVQPKSNIKKVVFAVDASQELFKEDADLFVVHHGILWKNTNLNPIKGNFYKRIKKLILDEKGLYAVHLPLDSNNSIGNNIEISKKIGLTKIKNLDSVAKFGYLKNIKDFKELKKIVQKKINQDSKFYEFNNSTKKIAVCSGGGGKLINKVIEKGCDTFITGEEEHSIYHIAKEEKINLIFAGHYNTEVFGILALMNKIKKKFPNLDCKFIDIPTKL